MARQSALMFHSFVGRSTHARYTAAAHYRYITRPAATDYREHHGIPDSYKAAQDWLRRHENGSRKNGRVIDKLILIFPVGMEQAHAVEATRLFMDRVSGGHAPYMFALQSFEPGEINPHAHIIYVDKGRRFRTTDRGSTERLRQEWCVAANEVLEREGYDIRLTNHREMSREAPTEQLEPDPELDHESPELQEEPVRDYETLQVQAKAAATAIRELGGVRAALTRAYGLQTNAQTAHDAWKHHKSRLEGFEATLGQKARARSVAEDDLADRTRSNGKLKGFQILGWKTPGRVAAEEAQAEAVYARHDEKKALEALQQAERFAESQRAVADECDREWREVAGTVQEMKSAEKYFESQREELTKDLSAPEVWTLLENLDISEEEARTLFKDLGAAEYLAMMEREEGREID